MITDSRSSLEDIEGNSFQKDLPEADPLELRIKENKLIKERFMPRLYFITPYELVIIDYAQERINRLEDDNQR